MKVNSIKVGAIWSMIGQVVNIIIGFGILIVTTRFLGPEQYGELQTILTLIILSVMVADFGFSSSVARYVAENQNNIYLKSQYIFNGLLLKVSTSFLMILLMLYSLPFLESFFSIELEKYSYILIIITLLRSLREFLLKVMQGLRRFDIGTKLNIFYNIGNMVFVLLLLKYGFKINAILISETLITVIFLIIFIVINKKIELFKWGGLSSKIVKEILKYCVPMFFISMSFYIYMKTDTLMIQYFLGSLAVGYYSLSTMIISKVHSPLVAIGSAAGPAIVLLEKKEKSDELVKLFKTTFLLTFPICIGLFLVSKELIIVFFGDNFLPATPILQLMTVFLFFYCLNSVFTPVLDYLGFAKNRAIMVGISATINFLLNLILIPKFGGIGAVYSTLLTYSIYSFVILYTVISRTIVDKHSKIEIVKKFLLIFIASLLMLLCVYLLNLFFLDVLTNFIVSIVVGIASYSIFIIILKLITVKEVLVFFKKSKK